MLIAKVLLLDQLDEERIPFVLYAVINDDGGRWRIVNMVFDDGP